MGGDRVPESRPTRLLARLDGLLELMRLCTGDCQQLWRQLGQPRHVETIAALRRLFHQLVQKSHVLILA